MILEDITCTDPQTEERYGIRIEVLEKMKIPTVLSLMVVEEYEDPECDDEDNSNEGKCSKRENYNPETGVYEFSAQNGALIRAASYNGDFRESDFKWKDNFIGEIKTDDPNLDSNDLTYEKAKGGYVAQLLNDYLARESNNAQLPIKRKDTLKIIRKCLEKVIADNPMQF